MYLTPREQEKLLVTVAADLARRRRQRGLKLNYPEAVALIASELMEGARDGRSVADLMGFGKTILAREDVMAGGADMSPQGPVGATFPGRATSGAPPPSRSHDSRRAFSSRRRDHSEFRTRNAGAGCGQRRRPTHSGWI